jgi:hypothetical protein
MKYFFFNILYFHHLWLCQKKVLQTKFTTDNITIDGKLDETGNPPEATNFIMFQPDNGRTIPENKKQS